MIGFINIAGFPAQISFEGIFFVTTEQAAIIEFSQIATLYKIVEYLD